MKRSPICFVISAVFCVGMVSCNSSAPKVDVGWVGEHVSAPQNDTVINESSQNLPQLATQPAASQTGFASVRQWPLISQMQQQPFYQQMLPEAALGAPPAAQPVSQPQTATTYVVRSGDSLSAIAARYGVSTATLISANGMGNDPNRLAVGQVLRIPAGNAPVANTTPAYPVTASQTTVPSTSSYRMYTVAQGDTLSGIARRHGVTVTAIMTLNGMSLNQANSLRIGQNIKLPLK